MPSPTTSMMSKKKYAIEQKINYALTPLLNHSNDKHNENGIISEEPLINQSRDTVKLNVPLRLPSIMKSIDSTIEVKNDDYVNNLRPPNHLNTAGSIRSSSNTRNEQVKGAKSKSLVPGRKSKLANQKHKELITLDFEDAMLSKYIQKIYKKQK
jgi:hypothetical protein